MLWILMKGLVQMCSPHFLLVMPAVVQQRPMRTQIMHAQTGRFRYDISLFVFVLRIEQLVGTSLATSASLFTRPKSIFFTNSLFRSHGPLIHVRFSTAALAPQHMQVRQSFQSACPALTDLRKLQSSWTKRMHWI